jgi:DNA-binding transcriptional LysR family regulator
MLLKHHLFAGQQILNVQRRSPSCLSDAESIKLIFMELYQIRHFIAVAEAASFTKGAERAAVSQSAISISIAKIESELYVRLIDRRLSPIRLTTAGQRLLESGKDILHRYDVLAAELKLGANPRYLRIGVLRSLLLFDGATSSLLSSFRRANPQVLTEVIDDECEHLTELLATGEVDASLTKLEGEKPEYATRVLFTMPYWLAIRDDHRYANKRVLNLSDLCDEPLIMPTRSVYCTIGLIWPRARP